MFLLTLKQLKIVMESIIHEENQKCVYSCPSENFINRVTYTKGTKQKTCRCILPTVTISKKLLISMRNKKKSYQRRSGVITADRRR